MLKLSEPKDGFWVMLYLHDWNSDGKVYPQAHGLYRSWKEAEQARSTKAKPEQYTVTRVNLIKGRLAKLEGIEDQDVFKEDLF